MRLTLINQFYPPELAPTGHLMASLARHRAQLGDDVTVVTSRGGYVPTSGAASTDMDAGLFVHRLWVPRLGKSTTPRRIVDYTVFFLLALLRVSLMPRQDVVVCMTTPPFIALAGTLHKALHRGTKLLLWVMDCYPEVMEAAGAVQTGGLADRAMRWLSRWLFRRVDTVVCLDQAMATLMTERYAGDRITPDVHIIPNWESARAYPLGGSGLPWEPAEKLRLRDRFVVLYLGNAGFGHLFETVLSAAEQLDPAKFSFLFVGGGAAWPGLFDEVERRGLDQIHLMSYVPKEVTPRVLAAADCGLITLRDEYLGLVSPSKLHAYLATGLPIVYVGPEGNNVDQAIRRFECGKSIRHGDVNGLVSFVTSLREEPDYSRQLASRSRKAFESEYTEAVNLTRFDQLLADLAPTNHPQPASG